MRVTCPVNTLDVLLKQCYIASRCQRLPARRAYATAATSAQAQNEVEEVAVLGGGITGLASAWYISKELPHARITLYEGRHRLGGWLHSKQVDVGGSKVVFEQGPRTLRPSIPNGMVTLELIHELGLEDQVIMTSKNSVAAQNRFIYYPDHLVRMPGPEIPLLQNLASLFTEEVFGNVSSGLLFENWQIQRSKLVVDESVASFVSRRLGSALADNILSAVLHGIYAGDIYQLSAKTILSKQYFLEYHYGSIMKGALNGLISGTQWVQLRDLQTLRHFQEKPLESEKLKAVAEASVFTFKKGIGELAERLESKLRERSNVRILTKTRITELRQDESGKNTGWNIITNPSDALNRSSKSRKITHVISTLSGKALNAIYRKNGKHQGLWYLDQAPSVTVMVVNLFFSNPALLPVHGFGYLLPRSIPFTQNPERALGVVFDTDATVGQDSIPGTKLTVMLGGHWWDGWNSYPDEEEGASMAKSIIARHLGITEEPQAVHVGLQKECIPQYTVGHDLRMQRAHHLLEQEFNGRLRVAGNSYTGVGLNDCVRAARDVVQGLVTGEQKTGLDDYVQGLAWAQVRPKKT
ncbi:MAG: protoporphyrinogen oxidase [Lasallia pustulata]|uniref:Protoporphyrinogen oxidase n=1 Tax=Lasallia pustulata TaxID=136370 RepID=A0A5M8PVU4_9LECA|nr:MAG: protoporphyrinogen oxidase [Lasallia pustulata]